MPCSATPLLLPHASAWIGEIGNGNIGLPLKSNVFVVHLLEGPHPNIHESRHNFVSI
jgi:hypothetical protein